MTQLVGQPLTAGKPCLALEFQLVTRETARVWGLLFSKCNSARTISEIGVSYLQKLMGLLTSVQQVSQC